MKKNYAAIFLFFSFTLFSQSYIPLPQSNCVWSTLEYVNTKFLPGGDSTYKLKTYKKFFSTHDSTLASSTFTFEGLMRQDTAQQMVYFIPKTKTTEVLLYDFSIGVNDSVIVYSPFGNSRITVTQKDSVLVSGIYRKRWKIKPANFSQSGFIFATEWIEGVGSNSGPLFPAASSFRNLDASTCSPVLLCLKTGIDLHKFSTFCNGGSCSVIPEGLNEIQRSPSFVAYPSPANDHLTIRFREVISDNASLQIKNLLGQNMKLSCESADQMTFRIGLESLTPGIYFVEHKSNAGNVTTRKFVKE